MLHKQMMKKGGLTLSVQGDKDTDTDMYVELNKFKSLYRNPNDIKQIR